MSETPIVLKSSFIPKSIDIDHDKIISRKDFGFTDSDFVMAAFGNSYKITENMFNTWIEILHEIPNSILWLTDDNDSATLNLRKEAGMRGIENNRIIFSKRSTYPEYKARLKLVDIFIDNFPYNCGSTASDVISSGIPLVTLRGNTIVSRMGHSLLMHAGLPELIADNIVEYKSIIKLLSEDQIFYNNIKNKLAIRLYSSQKISHSTLQFEDELLLLLKNL
jgi:predicted O-linked N-acetylglucosamine transferase (SPINDLY family)